MSESHSFLIPHSSFLVRAAVGQGDELGDLAAGGVGAGAEVGAVLRVARLARPAAGVAADDAAARPSPRSSRERAGWAARRRRSAVRRARSRVAPRQGDHLAELAAGDVVAGAEVGAVLRVARLARPAAGVAADDAVRRPPSRSSQNGLLRRHIGEGLLRGRDWHRRSPPRWPRSWQSGRGSRWRRGGSRAGCRDRTARPARRRCSR